MTAEVSKLNAYAVLAGSTTQVSKLNVYAVLRIAPVGVALAATENRDTAAFHVTVPIGTALAATESRDIAAFLMIPPTSAQTRVVVMA